MKLNPVECEDIRLSESINKPGVLLIKIFDASTRDVKIGERTIMKKSMNTKKRSGSLDMAAALAAALEAEKPKKKLFKELTEDDYEYRWVANRNSDEIIDERPSVVCVRVEYKDVFLAYERNGGDWEDLFNYFTVNRLSHPLSTDPRKFDREKCQMIYGLLLKTLRGMYPDAGEGYLEPIARSYCSAYQWSGR